MASNGAVGNMYDSPPAHMRRATSDTPPEEEGPPIVLHSESAPAYLGDRGFRYSRPTWTRRWGSVERPPLDTQASARTLRERGTREATEEGPLKGCRNFCLLALGATGVVFGDIGTSPLYTYSGIFVDTLHANPTVEDLVGTFSMIFWTITLVVFAKYVIFVMRVSHHGEGGVFALMQVALEALEGKSSNGSPSEVSETSTDEEASDVEEAGGRWQRSCTAPVITLGVLGCALLIGDGVITPVISVLSALQGFPISQDLQVALGVVILISLFSMQKFGSRLIGLVAGPVMVCWFLAIGTLGAYNLYSEPKLALQMARGFSPVSGALHFWTQGQFRGLKAWKSMAGVVLCATGCEALYADMGHFGAGPISFAFCFLAYPALILQYWGQSVALARDASGIGNAFYTSMPQRLVLPMSVLATVASVLASQALISGLFSLLSQAYALGFVPRIKIVHTNPEEHGQVFIPEVNAALCVACVLMTVVFQTSSSLAGAYGIAVTGTFLVTTILLSVVLRKVWKWRILPTLLVILPMATVDLLFWSANMVKILESGWVPLAITAVAGLMMHSHKWGRRQEQFMYEKACLEAEDKAHRLDEPRLSFAHFRSVPALFKLLRTGRLHRTASTGVFLHSRGASVPRALANLARSLECLPRTIVLMDMDLDASMPFVPEAQRAQLVELDASLGLFAVHLAFGYAEPLTEQNFAIQQRLRALAEKNVVRFPGLRPFLDFKGSDDGAETGAAELLEPSDSEDALELAGLRPVVGGGGPLEGHAPVTYFLRRSVYLLSPESNCWKRFKARVFHFMVSNARRPVTFFGLERANTMEVSVTSFL